MDRTLYYLPSLHRDSAPAGIPAGVLFLASLLDADAPAALCGGAHALPFTPAEGRALVRDMLAMGESLGAEGQLSQLAASADLARKTARDRLDPEEETALAAFADRGLAPQGTDPGGTQAEDGAKERAVAAALESAHKVLLLALAREEKIRDAQALEKMFQGAQSALSASLGEGALDDELLSGEYPADGLAPVLSVSPVSPAKEGAFTPAPWRLICEAAFAFIADTALCLSADAAMARDLEESGLLQPLPAELAGVLEATGFAAPVLAVPPVPADLAVPADPAVPANAPHSGRYLRLPGWRIVGHAAPKADKPWLNAPREMVVLPGPAGAESKPVNDGN